MARGGREFFVTGHSEYSPYTLDTEYRRDLGKGLPIEIPRNYYEMCIRDSIYFDHFTRIENSDCGYHDESAAIGR